ncbi:hypothetical protein [Enemella evansiae]|uniref:hypothetical protein n=1 Tax=Enemella evansiae TaxID=2016499 RepID=UPI00117D88BD|nr:hypothetical protein [Enemella evansiae]
MARFGLVAAQLISFNLTVIAACCSSVSLSGWEIHRSSGCSRWSGVLSPTLLPVLVRVPVPLLLFDLWVATRFGLDAAAGVRAGRDFGSITPEVARSPPGSQPRRDQRGTRQVLAPAGIAGRSDNGVVSIGPGACQWKMKGIS